MIAFPRFTLSTLALCSRHAGRAGRYPDAVSQIQSVTVHPGCDRDPNSGACHCPRASIPC
jgi:hypothetical protein